jgi:hypothetical protein
VLEQAVANGLIDSFETVADGAILDGMTNDARLIATVS